MNTLNFFNKEKADELSKLGFRYVKQRVGEDKFVYVFINTPELMKNVNGKFSQNDFYIGKTLNF